ncbi:class A beta-lactamase-related serine hydrolase [Rhodococcus sp. ACPA1]|uniref:class A beta-lactamase-related serine hydrolase n=1 Tax=Rhodococcus sp. ACPA1 TaxID=2028572 RepID=UPI00211C7429|nr:class A beta-lactamase-related serine hydrolase [Rhodococcus sp. ACPA1]
MSRLFRCLTVMVFLLGAPLACTIPTETNSVVDIPATSPAVATPDLLPADEPPAGDGVTVSPEPFPSARVPVSAPLAERISAAVATAATERGAEVSIAVLDRATGSYLEGAAAEPVETASLAKLFIAAQMYHLDAIGERPLSDNDHLLLKRMLESSDDDAANTLWDDLGGSDVVVDVAGRYGLAATTPPWDGLWWNTETTAADLVTFYAGLLDDRDGLGPGRIAEFVDYLRSSTPEGIDGYDQRFGLPEGLPGENVVGVKQGWMCCVGDRWIHVSTGLIGDDNRYIVAVASREDIRYEDDEESYPDTAITDVTEDSSARHARDTMTGFVKSLFPTGVVDDWAQPQS